MSLDEAETYFKSDSDRKTQATQYAIDIRGVRATEETKSCWWWLPSPRNTKRYASVVSRSGSIDDNGELINSDFVAIRPAMWINLEG